MSWMAALLEFTTCLRWHWVTVRLPHLTLDPGCSKAESCTGLNVLPPWALQAVDIPRCSSAVMSSVYLDYHSAGGGAASVRSSDAIDTAGAPRFSACS